MKLEEKVTKAVEEAKEYGSSADKRQALMLELLLEIRDILDKKKK